MQFSAKRVIREDYRDTASNLTFCSHTNFHLTICSKVWIVCARNNSGHEVREDLLAHRHATYPLCDLVLDFIQASWVLDHVEVTWCVGLFDLGGGGIC